MTTADYLKLPEAEKQQFQSRRTCSECGEHCVRDGHSLGDMHVVCPRCNNCPDCEDGE